MSENISRKNSKLGNEAADRRWGIAIGKMMKMRISSIRAPFYCENRGKNRLNFNEKYPGSIVVHLGLKNAKLTSKTVVLCT